MHTHIGSPIRELMGLLFLTHGVTAVAETGDAHGTAWGARQRIQAGEVPGPRIFASGPVLDGYPPFLPTSWAVRNAAEARHPVATLAALGADVIKVHHKLSSETLAGIRQAATEKGLRVVRHIPTSVPFEEAGIWDVQHLDGMVPYPQSPESQLGYLGKWRDLDDRRHDFCVGTFVEQGLVHTPTLLSGYALTFAADPRYPVDPAAGFLQRWIRDVAWDRRKMPLFRRFSGKVLPVMAQAMGRYKDVVRRLYQAGVRLHLGTEVGMPFLIAAVDGQQELNLMVEAGLPFEAASEAATRASGASLAVPLLGTMREDAPADLLILGQDPSRDLAALSTLQGVIAQGRLYPKEFLDEAIRRHREPFGQPLYDKLSTTLLRLGMKMMVPKN